MQHVQIAENGVGAYTIPSVDKNYEIIATFAVKAYRITISPVISEKIGGKIMPSGEISAACGSSKTFTITPDDCYKISDFRVDGTSDIDQVEIDENGVGVYTIPSVDKDYDIEATFAIKNIIEATSEGRCIIEPSGKVEVGCGEDQTFKITVPEGCEISQVTVNGQSVGKVTEYTFENLTTDDNRIHAVCECDEYPINAEASGANTISPSGEVPVVRGNDITFAITSENDSFCLVVDGELAEATKQSDSEYTYTFENVQADHTIKVFDECHNITTDVAGEGIRVEPSREVIVEHGKDQTITVTAEAGTLITVMVDGELEKSGGNPEWTHTFSNVVEDHSIQVFQFFVITATGDISPSGEMTVYYGASLTFRSPEGLIVDGQPVEATDYYKFENVMEPHCIQCIDMTGAVSVLKFLAGVDMDGAVPCLDFNQDGKVDMIDALYMFRQLSAQ
jgi:hypothetical protein